MWIVLSVHALAPPAALFQAQARASERYDLTADALIRAPAHTHTNNHTHERVHAHRRRSLGQEGDKPRKPTAVSREEGDKPPRVAPDHIRPHVHDLGRSRSAKGRPPASDGVETPRLATGLGSFYRRVDFTHPAQMEARSFDAWSATHLFPTANKKRLRTIPCRAPRLGEDVREAEGRPTSPP